MSVYRFTQIMCDGPGPTGNGCDNEVTDSGSAQIVRRDASRAGWLVGGPKGTDLCPSCRPGRERTGQP